VAIIGDIAHSRVARSNVHLLSKFGPKIVLCGPASLLPVELAATGAGRPPDHRHPRRRHRCRRHHDAAVQLERQHEAVFRPASIPLLPATATGAHGPGQPEAIVMLRGPSIRGRELSSEVGGFPGR